jgi:capsular exopolysaccharide synthesis family protein
MARSLPERQARREEAQSNDFSQRLVTIADPANAASEVYRTLRTRLFSTRLADGRQPKVILVTSPGSMEGKSTTCANLGVVLAQADKDVLLVDCDFRRPAIHRIFALRNQEGIVNVLAGGRDLQDVWQEPIPRLKAVAVGPAPPNPTELLSSWRFARVIDRAREEFDYVLLDSPPSQQVSDPEVLATQSDGVLLVLDVRSTPKGTLRHSVRSMEAVGANILGTVVNNVPNGKGARF